MNFISATKEESSSAGDYERERSWENSLLCGDLVDEKERDEDNQDISCVERNCFSFDLSLKVKKVKFFSCQ